MAFKWQYLILIALLLHDRCHAYLLPIDDADCRNSDNETNAPKEKCSWLAKFQRNLGKYRNFYASLLQEDNENFDVEIQELYNIMSMALVESDLSKKHRMIFYSIWLVETTKNLEDFLLAKGISNF